MSHFSQRADSVAVTSNSSAKLIMNKQQTVSQQSDITGSLHHADGLNRLLRKWKTRRSEVRSTPGCGDVHTHSLSKDTAVKPNRKL